jgi:WD40 repeat protein
MTLEGHDATVTCATFCPHFTSTLVSASDDRTFKVRPYHTEAYVKKNSQIWDLSQQTLIYQSSIISSSPFISIAMNPLQPSFALGTSDGILRIFDLADQSDFRCLHFANIAKVLSIADEKRDAPLESASNGELLGPLLHFFLY